jgi:hypothetical protein
VQSIKPEVAASKLSALFNKSSLPTSCPEQAGLSCTKYMYTIHVYDSIAIA